MSESTSEPRRIRAGDADRDRVVAALQSHREAGRLTAEEFEERMESALMARWLDELPPLLSDLPGEERAGGRDPRGSGGPQPGYGPHGQPGYGPGYGQPGYGLGGWRGPGRGPWGDPAAEPGETFGRGPCGHPPGVLRFLMVLAPFLVLGALIGSVAAIASGHFPFPLLWLAAAAFWFRPWVRWRRYGWYGAGRR